MVRLRRLFVAGALTPVLALAFWSAATPQAPPASQASCGVPPGILGASRPLPNTARVLHAGGPLGVLAIGSAFGQSRYLGADDSLPARIAADLRKAWPDKPVELRLRSDRGATTGEMVAVLRRELSVHPAVLVLWQTGTVDAARKISVAAFGQALAQGVQLARQAGSDIILIDPQYSRVLEAHVDVSPYEEQFARAASAPGAALFPRYALMHSWVRSGGLDLERAGRPERREAVAELQLCLAHALSREIIAGVEAGQQTGAKP